ncbi:MULTISPECIES: ATP-binding protein [Chryseobacterium]|nr:MULTISPECIES: ATP-binding protein [Chryseobacterium]MBL7881302.1 histidine kinase [Chryseobacterium gambrini]MCQ4138566.1 histidine kinase [Chryseobacterium sp. EO14]MCY1663136.1 histidine kinase [Chryseobacterium sp. SL1]MDO3425994.1 histidine kinase [Chryseobacterium sp. APV1]WBX98721.1 histidine kinase [Chryseobacterium gambrini]
MTFILLAYRSFIQRIIKEKNAQYEAEVQHQKNLALENIKAQESERKRIAVMIHDDIGNRLNILSLWLNNLDTKGDELIKKNITTQMSSLIDSARSISHSLYPVNLESVGLVLYIEELIANLSGRINISLNVSPKFQKKEIFVEVQLYRIIQEFTTNVLKHSEASRVWIYIKDNKTNLAVIISDNGQSFEYDEVKKGMGIKNIESRIKSMNAAHKWKNTLGKGSRLIIKIPYNELPDQNSIN